jgi:hypothetical protein
MGRTNVWFLAEKLLIAISVSIAVFISSCKTGNNQVYLLESSWSQVIDQGDSGRNFDIGMVPSPKSIPGSSFEDLANAHKELGNIADVAMIWGNPGGIKRKLL